VNGFLIAIVIVAMTAFADFRPQIAVIAPSVSQKNGESGDAEHQKKEKRKENLFFLHLHQMEH